MVFNKNICVKYNYVSVYSIFMCKIHAINKTFNICYCVCIKHFLASVLIITYPVNVLVVLKMKTRNPRKIFLCVSI